LVLLLNSLYLLGTEKEIFGADKELKIVGAELIKYLQEAYHQE